MTVSKDNLPPRKISDGIFYFLLLLVIASLIALVAGWDSNFVQQNKAILVFVAVFAGVPVFGTLLMVIGERIGRKK